MVNLFIYNELKANFFIYIELKANRKKQKNWENQIEKIDKKEENKILNTFRFVLENWETPTILEKLTNLHIWNIYWNLWIYGKRIIKMRTIFEK